MNALVESWGIHNRINLYLLDAIPEEALGSVSASKGRAVGQQIALTLKQAGHPLDKKTAFGLWEWGVR